MRKGKHKPKKATLIQSGFFVVMVLWRLPTLPGLTQVSSAVPGLTSLFGMGRGEHRANSHQQDFLLICGMKSVEANVAPDRSNTSTRFSVDCSTSSLWVYNQCHIGSKREWVLRVFFVLRRRKGASCWVISTAQLNVFLHVHLQPINVVVYNDPCVEDSSSG